MLGTPMTRSLPGRLDTSGVHRSLNTYQAKQWFNSFASLSLLSDGAEQAPVIGRLIVAGYAGDAMMQSARGAWIESVQVERGLIAAAAIVGLCLAWFVPAVRVDRLDTGTRRRCKRCSCCGRRGIVSSTSVISGVVNRNAGETGGKS